MGGWGQASSQSALPGLAPSVLPTQKFVGNANCFRSIELETLWGGGGRSNKLLFQQVFQVSLHIILESHCYNMSCRKLFCSQFVLKCEDNCVKHPLVTGCQRKGSPSCIHHALKHLLYANDYVRYCGEREGE